MDTISFVFQCVSRQEEGIMPPRQRPPPRKRKPPRKRTVTTDENDPPVNVRSHFIDYIIFYPGVKLQGLYRQKHIAMRHFLL